MVINKKKTLIGLGAAILVVGAGAAAVSAAGGRMGWHGGGFGMGGMMHGFGMREVLKGFDADKDGKLAQAEIDKVRQDQLARYDADKDGKLNMKEFEGVLLETMKPVVVRGFQFLDTNGDGIIDADEYNEPTQKIVARFDRNSDGFIDENDRGRGGHGKWRHGRQGGSDGPMEKPADAPASPDAN